MEQPRVNKPREQPTTSSETSILELESAVIALEERAKVDGEWDRMEVQRSFYMRLLGVAEDKCEPMQIEAFDPIDAEICDLSNNDMEVESPPPKVMKLEEPNDAANNENEGNLDATSFVEKSDLPTRLFQAIEMGSLSPNLLDELARLQDKAVVWRFFANNKVSSDGLLHLSLHLATAPTPLLNDLIKEIVLPAMISEGNWNQGSVYKAVVSLLTASASPVMQNLVLPICKRLSSSACDDSRHMIEFLLSVLQVVEANSALSVDDINELARNLFLDLKLTDNNLSLLNEFLRFPSVFKDAQTLKVISSCLERSSLKGARFSKLVLNMCKLLPPSLEPITLQKLKSVVNLQVPLLKTAAEKELSKRNVK